MTQPSLSVHAQSCILSQDNESLSPLHWAVMCEQPDHIRHFLSFPSVDVSVQDCKGRIPLVYAVLNFSPACIKVYMPALHEYIAVVGTPFHPYRPFLTAVKLQLITETPKEGQHCTLPVQRAQLTVCGPFSHAKSKC